MQKDLGRVGGGDKWGSGGICVLSSVPDCELAFTLSCCVLESGEQPFPDGELGAVIWVEKRPGRRVVPRPVS